MGTMLSANSLEASSSRTDRRPSMTTTAFSRMASRKVSSTLGNTITSMVPVRSSTLVKAITLLDLVVIMRFLTTAQTTRTRSPSVTWASSPVRSLMVWEPMRADFSR